MQTKSIFAAPVPSEPPASAPAEPVRADALFQAAAPPTAALDAASLFRAAASAPDALPDAVRALCLVANAVASGELVRCPAAELQDLRLTIADALHPVSRSAGDRIPEERVALGLAAASGIVTVVELRAHSPALAVLNDDRIDHLYLLVDELDALIRRRRIEARGDVLRRMTAANRALAKNGDGATLH